MTNTKVVVICKTCFLTYCPPPRYAQACQCWRRDWGWCGEPAPKTPRPPPSPKNNEDENGCNDDDDDNDEDQEEDGGVEVEEPEEVLEQVWMSPCGLSARRYLDNWDLQKFLKLSISIRERGGNLIRLWLDQEGKHWGRLLKPWKTSSMKYIHVTLTNQMDVSSNNGWVSAVHEEENLKGNCNEEE